MAFSPLGAELEWPGQACLAHLLPGPHQTVGHTLMSIPVLMWTSWKPPWLLHLCRGPSSMPSATRDSRQRALYGIAGSHSPWGLRPQVTCPTPWYPSCRSCPYGHWAALLPLGNSLPQLLPISEGLPGEPQDNGIDPVGIVTSFSLGITITCRTARMPSPPRPPEF